MLNHLVYCVTVIRLRGNFSTKPECRKDFENIKILLVFVIFFCLNLLKNQRAAAFSSSHVELSKHESDEISSLHFAIRTSEPVLSLDSGRVVYVLLGYDMFAA